MFRNDTQILTENFNTLSTLRQEIRNEYIKPMKEYIIEAKKQGQITASQPHINPKLQEYVEQRTEFLKTYKGIQLWNTKLDDRETHSAQGGAVKLQALERNITY